MSLEALAKIVASLLNVTDKTESECPYKTTISFYDSEFNILTIPSSVPLAKIFPDLLKESELI